MSLIDTLCKGAWESKDLKTNEIFTRECLLRKTCLRYIARHSVEMVAYYDVIPVKAFMEQNLTAKESEITCQYYQKWN